MNLFDLYEVSRKPRRAKSLYERARKYIGAVKGPLNPKNTAAQTKTLVSASASVVAHRSRARLFSQTSEGRTWRNTGK